MKVIATLLCAILTVSLGFALWLYLPSAENHHSEWQLSEPMPTARSEIAAAALDQQLYVAGGIGPLTSDAFERYDIVNNRWQQLKSLPAARHHVAMSTLNGEVYAVGGFSTLGFKASADAWAYSPETKNWRSIAQLPEARGEHAMVVVGDSLYIVAGSSSRSREVWKYTVRNGASISNEAAQWVPVGDLMPTARDSTAAVVLGTTIWVIGGRSSEAGDLAVVEIFDTETGKWSTGPELPQPRAGHAAAAVAGRIIVFGGESLATAKVYPEVLEWVPESQAWLTKGNLPKGRHGLAGIADSGKVFAIGGAVRAGLRTPLALSHDVAVIEVGL